MTPERAKEIYYASLTESFATHQLNWKEPRIQLKCELEAWGVVIDEIRKETELNMVREMADRGVFSASHLPQQDESRSDPPR